MGEPPPRHPGERPLEWDAERLWQQLEPLLPGLSVEIVAHSVSTNSALLERARVVRPALGANAGEGPTSHIGRRQADALPNLLVAEHQALGRGRMGRAWRSARGASLTFSLGLLLSPRAWSGLSLAVGVALAEALQPDGDASGWRLGLKWPNDLWLARTPSASQVLADGRKLGGVLVETLAAGERRLAVVGVGLNVATLDGVPSHGVHEPIACLREIDPDATAPGALARVALPLVQALKTFERHGFAAFVERFAALDLLRDQPIVSTDPLAAEGTARGVDADGRLRVQTPSGLHHLHSGEVSVRPLANAAALARRTS